MTVYIAFYHAGGSFIDKAIQWWTASIKEKFNGEWRKLASHVELSFDGVVWYSASTRHPMNYRRKAMTLSDAKWRTYKIEVTKTEYELMEESAILMLGMKYDWLNILGGDILKLDVGSNGRVTCDESVAILLRYIDRYRDISKRVNLLDPHTLEVLVRSIG